MPFAVRARSVVVCAALALAAPAALLAQRYTFRQYGSADGLSNLSINCLIQDRTGYIWVGTDNGLFRYDGGRFTAFGHAEGLANSEIHSIAVSPSGVLWAATEGGLVRWTGSRFAIVTGTEKNAFQSIAFDGEGNFYLASAAGLIRGVPDTAGGYQFSTVVQGSVTALFVGDSEVWFAQDGDLWRLGKFRPERVGSPAGLPSEPWSAIAQDALGNLWARSATKLYELPRNQPRFVNRSEGVPHASRTKIYADRHGRVYVSSNAGVVILEGSTRTYLDPEHGLPADTSAPVLLDRDETLWIGMFGGGVLRRLGHGEWLAWKTWDGLVHNSVWSVLHDATGRLWVGTSAGLNIFAADGKPLHTWTQRSGLAGDWVRSIVQGPAGDFYLGTSPGGITRLDKNGVPREIYGRAAGLATNEIVATVLDHEKHLWVIGPTTGCFRSRTPLDSKTPLTFERVAIPGMPAGASFRNVSIANDGAVWIGTSEGLVRYDGGRWRIFSQAAGLVSGDVSAIAPGKDEVWVAYRDAFGLTRLQFHGDAVKATRFTAQNGLSSDLIYALTLDHAGRLWASTDNGVSVLDQGKWTHYGREEGLIWDDGNDLALSVDAQNNVWIGTSGGLSRFASLTYPLPNSQPPVVITAVEGASQSFQPGDRPAIPHAQDSLLIRFSGLNYASETRLRFRYRLLGYKTEWNETRERSVHFEGLPGGHYIFEVVAAGPDGQWSTEPARFAFSIQPAWWQSWWFLTACLLVAGGLATAVWRYRMRVLLAQQQRLEKLVAEQTAALIESHRQLEELAYCDVLTGLPNRRMFSEQLRPRLAQARRMEKPFSLLLIDLDHFKHINDTYGHDAGDAVLMETALRLRLAVRESDCVARLGGDEFAILLTTASGEADIEAVCSRIIASLGMGMPFNGIELRTACSIGIAMFPGDGETQEGLYKAADLALYEAKRSSRNGFRWHGSLKIHRRPVDSVGLSVKSAGLSLDDVDQPAPLM